MKVYIEATVVAKFPIEIDDKYKPLADENVSGDDLDPLADELEDELTHLKIPKEVEIDSEAGIVELLALNKEDGKTCIFSW